MPGGDARPTALLVERGAEFLDEGVEAAEPKDFVEFGIEGMAGSLNDLGGWNEQLDLFATTFSEGHACGPRVDLPSPHGTNPNRRLLAGR